MSPSEEIKLTKFLKEVLKSRIDNLEKSISQILDVLDLVFNNISIWVLSMIHSLVFSVWTSMLFLKDQEVELVLEEDANQELVLNTESPKTKLWNGSEENMMVPFIIDSIRSFTYTYIFKLSFYSFFMRFNLNFFVFFIFWNLKYNLKS